MDDDPIELPIDGVLDLHTFSPSEVKELVAVYLDACHEKGILDVRIIHGKGTGTLREVVQAVLKQHGRVESFASAGENWGATLVRLR